LPARVFSKCPEVAKRKQPREIPLIDIQLDWGTYSEKHFKKTLAGKPKMVIYDADKPKMTPQGEPEKDSNGLPIYEEATIDVNGKEEPITANNAHLFINDGCTIVHAVFSMDTCFVNNNQASMPIRFTQMVVRKNTHVAAQHVSTMEGMDIFDDVKPTKVLTTESGTASGKKPVETDAPTL